MNENEGESGAVDAEAVVLLENGEPVSAVVHLPESGEETPMNSEAVQIAEIRAETEIAVTAINADVETARIEAQTERDLKWVENEAALAAALASMREQAQTIADLQEQLSLAIASHSIQTPQVDLEAEAIILESETPPELNLMPQSIPESETETETGANEEGENEVIALALTVPGRKRRRLI